MKRFSWTALFFAFISAGAPLAHAGGWVSSGGENLRDGLNPWFLQNVSRVRYCVSVDQTGISAPVERVRALVAQAIRYWVRDLTEVQRAFHGGDESLPGFTARVGTQEFFEGPCSGQEDLRFLFGRKTLSREEAEYLGDTGRYIGVAVRTSYDPVRLKGRGFIHVASDRGPGSMSQPGAVTEAWRHEGLLFRVIVHELGHVFGLPHMEAGLMMQAYPELILKKENFTAFVAAETLESYLLPSKTVSLCSLSAAAQQALGIVTSGCIQAEVLTSERRSQAIRFRVGSGAQRRLELSSTQNPSREFKTHVHVQLGSEQALFPGFLFLPVPTSFVSGFSAQSRRLDGTVQPLFFKIGPGTFEMLGVTGDGIEVLARESWFCRTDFCHNSGS